MNIKAISAFLFGAVFLSSESIAQPVSDSSAGMQSLNSGASAQSGTNNGDAYFIFRVTPADTKLEILQLKIEDGRVKQWKRGLLGSYYTQRCQAEHDGYCLVKARSNVDWGISSVIFSSKRYFSPCHGVLSFNSLPGKVIYVADIDYVSGPTTPASWGRWPKYRAAPTYHVDMNGAYRFLKEYHPELLGDLEQGRASMITNDVSDFAKCY